MMMVYRVVFKDGTFGAWYFDYEYIKETADFFGGTVEGKVIGCEV